VTPGYHCCTTACTLRDLQVVVDIALSDHDGHCVKSFVKTHHSNGWLLSKHDVSFPAQGNSIAGVCHIIIGTHTLCALTVKPILLKEPLPTPPCPIGLSIWEPFNRPNHSVCLTKDNDDFCCQDVRFTAQPTIPAGLPTGVLVKYFLHQPGWTKPA
jgi:hypothetical protein